MPTSGDGLSRRDFLHAGAGLAAAGVLATVPRAGAAATAAEPTGPPAKSRVVLVRDGRSVSADEKIDPAAVGRMLDAGILELLGTRTVEEGWARHFRPEDVVGLRVNCNGHPGMVSSPALAYAISERLVRVGVKENNVVIWERREDELTDSGYEINKSDKGVRVIATMPDHGFDEQETDFGSGTTRWSRILSGLCTCQVNVAKVKTTIGFGIAIGMKFPYGLINNPADWHPNHGVPFAADMYRHPMVSGRTRMIIADALTILTDAGPWDDERYHRVYGGLLLGFDPVAIDRVSLEILERVRGKPVDPFPYHSEHAGKAGIGNWDRDRIELVEKVLG